MNRACRAEPLVTSSWNNHIIPMSIHIEGTDFVIPGTDAVLSNHLSNPLIVPRYVFDEIVDRLTPVVGSLWHRSGDSLRKLNSWDAHLRWL